MTKELILEKLTVIVKSYSQNQEALDGISSTTNFTTDLKINSANLVGVFLDVEQAF
jgi:acyl carrier protein